MRIASIREKHFLLTLRHIQEPGTNNMLLLEGSWQIENSL